MHNKITLCIVFVSAILIGCSDMQLYYLKDANMVTLAESNIEPITRNRPEDTKLLLNGHYVKSGDGLVLLLRRFEKGKTFTVDDETFEKLTIEIKGYTLDEPIRLDSPNIRFYYSSGSSGFISKGHGVYAKSATGHIVVKAVEKGSIIVGLDLTFWAEPAGPFPFEGREVKMKDEFIFTEKQLVGLSHWIGVPAKSFGEEVYP